MKVILIVVAFLAGLVVLRVLTMPIYVGTLGPQTFGMYQRPGTAHADQGRDLGHSARMAQAAAFAQVFFGKKRWLLSSNPKLLWLPQAVDHRSGRVVAIEYFEAMLNDPEKAKGLAEYLKRDPNNVREDGSLPILGTSENGIRTVLRELDRYPATYFSPPGKMCEGSKN